MAITLQTTQLGIGHGYKIYFNGSIDEVRVYSQALSAQEIQQHYVEGLKTHPQFAQK